MLKLKFLGLHAEPFPEKVVGMSLLNYFSLRARVLLIVGLSCGLCATVSIWGFLYFTDKSLETGIENKERTIHTQLVAAIDYVANQGGLAEVVERFRTRYKSPEQMTPQDKKEILNQVPIYAAMEIGRKNADSDKYRFRVFSNEPRRRENTANDEELAIFKKFESDTGLQELTLKNGQVITMYRPIRLSKEQGCLVCHGDPKTSPWGNGRDILGFPMENWSDGKLHGVFAISQDKAEVVAAATAGQVISPEKILILAIALGALVAIFLGSVMVSAPLNALNFVAQSLSKASHHVNSTSQQIAGASRDLSSATTEQAAALQETSSSIEEMSSMVSRNSDNAKNTSHTASDSRGKAEQGRKVVEQMMSSMDEINQSNNDIVAQIDQSNREMSEIVAVIREIGDKTKVINEIVFQTKLLSFNASVEAARAGEHGKGFAVVAEEVGNLAQMSGAAAKEISDMLEGSIRKVENIATETKGRVEELVRTGRSKVETGTNIARQCGSVLDEIVENISNVNHMAEEISSASQEQAAGVQQLTKAMQQLDQVTQLNAATSEQSASSASHLAEQARSLNEAVEHLVSTIRGQNRSQGSDEPTDLHPDSVEESAPLRRAA